MRGHPVGLEPLLVVGDGELAEPVGQGAAGPLPVPHDEVNGGPVTVAVAESVDIQGQGVDLVVGQREVLCKR